MLGEVVHWSVKDGSGPWREGEEPDPGSCSGCFLPVGPLRAQTATQALFLWLLFIYLFSEILFTLFWLHWVCMAAHGLFLVEVSGGHPLDAVQAASHCRSFSRKAWALGRVGFSCGTGALEHRLSGCGAWV